MKTTIVFFYIAGIVCWLVSLNGCVMDHSDMGTTNGTLSFLAGTIFMVGGAIIEALKLYLEPPAINAKKDS